MSDEVEGRSGAADGKIRAPGLSDLALDRPVTVGLALVALFLLGVIAIKTLPLAFLPSESVQWVNVRVRMERTSPEIVEREVIRPLEEEVAGVRDLVKTQVGSGSWGVRMRLQFRAGTDIDARKIELRERIDRMEDDLPDFVNGVEISSSAGAVDDPIMVVRIASDEDLRAAYYLIRERISAPLERVDGVARVELNGVEPHELEIGVDPLAVQQNGVELQSIAGVVRSAQRGKSMGIVRGPQDISIRSDPTLPTEEGYGALEVPRAIDAPAAATSSGSTEVTQEAGADPGDASVTADNPANKTFARLDDLAHVEVHPQEQRRGARLNGKPAINLDIYSDGTASPVEVARDVREAVALMQADDALQGIDVRVFEDQGEQIVTTLGDLRNTGIYGAIIGVIILFGFLHRVRTTLIVSVCIPLSVLGACAVLMLQGGEFNCIVLLGLVLGVGMLIDNGVVIIESIQAKLQAGLPVAQAAREGAREVGLATIASTVSSIIVFLPLLVGGSAGGAADFTSDLGITFIIALLSSLFVSQTAVPLLVKRFAKAERKPPRFFVLDILSKIYGAIVRITVSRPRLTIVLGLLLCASAYYPATKIRVQLGQLEEQTEALPISLELNGGRGYKTVIAKIEVLEAALLEHKDELGIDAIACRYRDWGGSCDVYRAEPFQSEQELSEFQGKVSAVLPPQPGVRYRVNDREGWRGGNRDPRVIEFAVKGEDMGTLFKLSEGVAAHLENKLEKGDPAHPEQGGYDRIVGTYNDGARELHVNSDPARLSQLGLTVDDLGRQISAAFAGVTLGQAQGPQGELSLRLSVGQMGQGDELSRSDLEQLPIKVAAGTGSANEPSTVPLASIADVEIERSPYWIQRVNRQTEARMSVRFFSDDREANQAAVDEALASYPFPDGYSAGARTRWWGGPEDNLELLIDLGLCLLLVYAVMASLFESFLQPMAILLTCLLGCVGAPWAIYLTDVTFDTVALIGLFILVGIVVNNGIMLIDKVTLLRARGIPRRDALVEAGQQRLRPILMTAATTILGLVPMLLHHPTLAGVYYHSIAVIIVGGLATSTVMTLIFLPAAYTLIEDVATAGRAIWRKIHR